MLSSRFSQLTVRWLFANMLFPYSGSRRNSRFLQLLWPLSLVEGHTLSRCARVLRSLALATDHLILEFLLDCFSELRVPIPWGLRKHQQSWSELGRGHWFGRTPCATATCKRLSCAEMAMKCVDSHSHMSVESTTKVVQAIVNIGGNSSKIFFARSS